MHVSGGSIQQKEKAMFNKKNKNSYEYASLSIKELLKYIEQEIIILQQDTSFQDNNLNKTSQNELEGAEACGLLMIENFMWEMLFNALFGGSMIADMFYMLAGDDFEIFLGGLSMMLDNDVRSQRLQAPFILSMYPRGRRTVRTILKNINSSNMRRSATKGFMSPADRAHKLAVLNKASLQLKTMHSAYFISHIQVNGKNSIASSIDNSFKHVSKLRAYA